MLLVILLAASLRFIGLDRFATVDEPAWLLNSANFYYALGQRDFEKTVAEYQPAVTGMWITTAALLDYFPEYRGQGQGYFTKIADFNQFLAAHGKQPLELLKRSRAITLIVNTILLVAAFFLLKYLIGAGAAFISALLIGLDPYFTGHARLLNHEALMCLFLLVSILAILVYLEVRPRLFLLFISAVAAGLALLTKSSATLILPFVGLIIGIKAFEQWRQDRLLRKALAGALKTLLIWLAGLVLTYFIVWPGMWVNPARMLYEVYGNALSYAFQGQGLALTQALNPQEFALESGGAATYLNALLWATTPLIWLGALLSGAALFVRDRQIVNTLTKKVIVYFALLGIAFILQFSLALGRNSAHYILASYMCLDILAADRFDCCSALAGETLPIPWKKAGSGRYSDRPAVDPGCRLAFSISLLLYLRQPHHRLDPKRVGQPERRLRRRVEPGRGIPLPETGCRPVNRHVLVWHRSILLFFRGKDGPLAGKPATGWKNNRFPEGCGLPGDLLHKPEKAQSSARPVIRPGGIHPRTGDFAKWT